MLTTTNCLFVLPMLGNGFQDYLLLLLPCEWAEAGPPVLPRSSFLPFMKKGVTFIVFQSSPSNHDLLMESDIARYRLAPSALWGKANRGNAGKVNGLRLLTAR